MPLNADTWEGFNSPLESRLKSTACQVSHAVRVCVCVCVSVRALGLGRPGRVETLLLPGDLETVLDLRMKSKKEQSPERESVWLIEMGAFRRTATTLPNMPQEIAV